MRRRRDAAGDDDQGPKIGRDDDLAARISEMVDVALPPDGIYPLVAEMMFEAMIAMVKAGASLGIRVPDGLHPAILYAARQGDDTPLVTLNRTAIQLSCRIVFLRPLSYAKVNWPLPRVNLYTQLI